MKIEPHNRILLGAIGLGIVLCLLTTVIEALFWNTNNQSFITLLKASQPMLPMRLILFFVCVVFGVILSKYVRKNAQTEAFLRESEKKYRTLFENTPIGLGIASAQGHLLAFNDAMMQPGKYTREDIEKIGNVANLYYDVDTRNRVLGLAQKQGFVYQYPVQFKRKDGTPYDALLSLTPVQIDGQLCWQALAEDMTQRNKTEREMIRIERLNALSELSAGICHNLNNILTGILGPTELIKDTTQNERTQRLLTLIYKSAQQAADLVKRFNETVEGSGKIQPVDLNLIIQDAVALTKPKWHDEATLAGLTIQIHIKLDAIQRVRAANTELHTAIVNILINAIEAMPKGGDIHITTQNDGDGVSICITDTGTGMDNKTLQRIFEPFFTTKATVGTGLGLSTAYSSIARWGGKFDVESQPQKGTTITLWLPAWPISDLPQEESEHPLSQTPAKILILDDDHITIQYLEHILSPYHDIQIFLDAQTALDQFKPGQYDIALIDLGLPNILGDKVARKLRHQDPLLSTILITGWALADDDHRLAEFDFYLSKPLQDHHKVHQTIAKALQRRTNRASTPIS